MRRLTNILAVVITLAGMIAAGIAFAGAQSVEIAGFQQFKGVRAIGTGTSTGAFFTGSDARYCMGDPIGDCDAFMEYSAGSGVVNFSGVNYRFFNGGTATGALQVGSILFNAGSGSNAISIVTNGARIDHGAGASDYSSSDGTTVTFAGPLATASTFSTAGESNSGNLTFTGSGVITSTGAGTGPVTVSDSDGLGVVGVATGSLVACNSTAPPTGTRGTLQYDTTTNSFTYCNGTAWSQFTPSGATIVQNSITGGGPTTIGTQRTKARQIICGLSNASAFYDLQSGAICGTQANLGTRASATISGSTVAFTTPFTSATTGVASYATTTAVGVLWQTAPEFEGWFRLDDTSNVAVKIQFSSTSASTNCTTNLNATNQDEATWKIDTSANANFQYCTGDGANVTCADAIAVDTAWHYFKIVFTPDATIANLTNVTFTLDSTTYTSTTTLPNLNSTTVLLPTICLDQTDDTGTVNLYSNGWTYRTY